MSDANLSEAAIQSRCFIWAWNNYPNHRQMLFHVNNKAMNRIEGSKFKAMGMVKGVSDMILVCPGFVVFMEFKLPGQMQKPEQVSFQQKVETRGHKYHIITSEKQFQELFKQYLRL